MSAKPGETATFSISISISFLIIYVQHLAHIKTISAQLKRAKNLSKIQNKMQKTKGRQKNQTTIMITRGKHEIVFNKRTAGGAVGRLLASRA